ncbi:MAG: periplasmic heavy metal sensor [Deltaproteobacteria bacterium]|nr:periplasmic heavy metal sensor [Deltaproteobacteria bacterium]
MNLARNVFAVLLGATLALAPVSPAWARPAVGPGHKGPLVAAADLLNRLKLTAAQKTRIFAVLGQHKNEIVAVGGAKVEAHAQLQDAIQAANPDPAAIKKAAATLAEADLKAAQLRARIHPQIMAILTPKQKLEVLAVMAHARGWMGGPGHEGIGGPGKGAGMGKGMGKGPGHMLGRILDFAGEHADLTAQQRDQIKGVVEGRKTQLMSLHKAQMDAEKALRTALHQPTPPSEKAIRRAAADVARARLDFALERAQIHARAAKVLTPAQRTQLESLRTDMQGVRLEQAHAILTLVRELL